MPEPAEQATGPTADEALERAREAAAGMYAADQARQAVRPRR